MLKWHVYLWLLPPEFSTEELHQLPCSCSDCLLPLNFLSLTQGEQDKGQFSSWSSVFQSIGFGEVFRLGQWTVTNWNIITHSLGHFPKLTLHQASTNQELHLQAQGPVGIMCIMTVPDCELETRRVQSRSKGGAVLTVRQVAGVADGGTMGAGSSIQVAWLACEWRGTRGRELTMCEGIWVAGPGEECWIKAASLSWPDEGGACVPVAACGPGHPALGSAWRMFDEWTS